MAPSRRPLTVLITRSLHQAQRLATLVERAGGRSILFPTIDIVASEDAQLFECLQARLNDYRHAIFISSNAVDCSVPKLNMAALGATLIAIGPATARALARYQLSYLMPAAPYNSEAVLAMPELQQVQQHPIAIIAGEGGRTVLAERLRARGAEVDKYAVYQRKLPNVALGAELPSWRQQGLNCIIASSLTSLQNLATLIGSEGTWLYQLPLCVISEALVGEAQRLGFKQVIQAANATDEAIVAALADI